MNFRFSQFIAAICSSVPARLICDKSQILVGFSVVRVFKP
jgi:hypothetical protein